jgi:hypothetical protein
MNLMCDCCKSEIATYIITGPTDANKKGERRCDGCSMATSAGMEPLTVESELRVTGEILEYAAETGLEQATFLTEIRERHAAAKMEQRKICLGGRLSALKVQRLNAAENSLNAIKKLRSELDSMEAAILAGENDEPVFTLDLTPGHQSLNEVVAYGTEYRTLWNAVGLLSR